MSSDAPASCDLPVLIGCSHGTADEAGRATVHDVLVQVRAARPELDVREAFVDVEEPEVAGVVAQVVAEGRRAVVVPLLLSAGFHVEVDIARAVAPHGTRSAVAAGALGPDDALVDVLVDRLAEATEVEPLAPGDAVVLAAAGSSSAGAVRAVEEVLGALRARLSVPVSVGYGSIARPRLPDAVAAARAAGARRVVVASYLLAPGHFFNQVAGAGADVVSAPLGSHGSVAATVLSRFDEGARALVP